MTGRSTTLDNNSVEVGFQRSEQAHYEADSAFHDRKEVPGFGRHCSWFGNQRNFASSTKSAGALSRFIPAHPASSRLTAAHLGICSKCILPEKSHATGA